MSQPFRIERPPTGISSIIVEVPHAGLQVAASEQDHLLASRRALQRDADPYMDEICAGISSCGATLLAATQSRCVCDLNRGPTDYDAQAAPGGTLASAPHGLFWHTSTDGKAAIPRPLGLADVHRRLDAIYLPYHQALAGLLEQSLDTHGYAILVCAHSMPSRDLRGNRHADCVPGTRGQSSAAPAVIHTVDRQARQTGWSIAHDWPYRGGFATAHWGRPTVGIHAIQIEINRELYLDEETLNRRPAGLNRVREFFRRLVSALSELDPAELRGSHARPSNLFTVLTPPQNARSTP